MCQCRPTDPTDPGDAADLSIMGYPADEPAASATPFLRISDPNSRAATVRNQHFLNQTVGLVDVKVNMQAR